MELLLLALEAALYPTLLAAVAILMTLERPLRLLAVYLAGAMVMSVGAGLVVVFALDGAVEDSRAELSWAADLLVGGFALLLAALLSSRADERLRRRRAARHPKPPASEPAREPWSQRLLARGSTPIVFLAAMAINLPGAAYLIALKDIAAGHHATATAVLLVICFNLIMFLLAEIPLLGLIFKPQRTAELVDAADAWLGGHGRQLAVAVCATLGLFLVIRGIAHT